jgi:alkanesulfonate monooxygenase SsuD/methylene tetrahydromethanopterin reductase-like flavin-dependent oxidoreductase (luciferase family)
VIRLGITLPSFRDTVEPALAVARAAEDAGVDAVFAYDHLFRRAPDGTRRPALEMFALLGAVAAETSRVAVGSLVARSTLRPAATLAHGFDTVARIAGADRLFVTIGAGDGHSEDENESFGLSFGTMDVRVESLREAVDATRDRGYPVWVGGHARQVRDLAAVHADGWNFWGTGLERFRERATAMRDAAQRPAFVVSWGGLVVLDTDDARAHEKAMRLHASSDVIVGGPATVAAGLQDYLDAGAEFLTVAPIDSSDPANATMFGDLVMPLLRDR